MLHFMKRNYDFSPATALHASMLLGEFWTFVDCLATTLVEPCDRVDFFAGLTALIMRGKRSREERSCVVFCSNRNQSQQVMPSALSLVTIRLWSDTGTQSFVLAVQVVRLPKSKYLRAAESEDSKRIHNQPTATRALLKSTQQLINRSKESATWVREREYLTEEQIIAEVLPLDEVLELDDLDMEAVAEILYA